MPISKITSQSIADGTVIASDILDDTITSAKIVSLANTKISGNIIASQITSVANTQLTGNIIASQITSVANTQITGNIIASQITSVANTQLTGNIIASQITSVANTQLTGNIIASQITSVANTQLTGIMLPANGGTGQSSLTANSVVIGNGTAAVQLVPPGNNGNVLVSDGTNWRSSSAPITGSLVHISTISANSSSQVDITGFNSTYDQYMITGSNIIPVTGGANNFLIRMDFGSGYLTSGYWWYVADTGSNSGQNAIMPLGSGGTISSVYAYNFVCYVHAPLGSAYKTVSGHGVLGFYQAGFFAGGNTTTSSLTGLRFLITGASSSILSGDFRFYGIKNS